MGFFYSLRNQLIFLALLALMPAVGLTVYSGIDFRRHEIQRAKEEVLSLARFLAKKHQRNIDSACQLLFTLSQLPQVRQGDPAACSTIFARLVDSDEARVNIAATDTDGNVIAGVKPLPPTIDTKKHQWLAKAVRTRNYVISNSSSGDFDNRPHTIVAYPVLNEAWEIRTVILAVLDLAWLNEFTMDSHAREGIRCGIIDAKGTILARHPNPENWVGRSVHDHPLFPRILQEREGTTDDFTLDGQESVIGFTALSKGPEPLFVYVCIPSHVAYARANKELVRGLSVLAAVAILALVACRLFGNRFIVRQVAELLRLTEQVESGDLTVRSGTGMKSGELGMLACAFDRMTETLQVRAAEQKLAQEELRRSEENHRLLTENASDIITRCTSDGTFLYVSTACRFILGYEPGELYGHSVYEFVHPDDVPVLRAMLEEILNTSLDESTSHRFRKKDGNYVWLETHARTTDSCEPDSAGDIFIVSRDISKRVQAEEALQQSETKYRYLVEQISAIIYSVALDDNRKTLYVSPQIEDIIGCSAEKCSNQAFWTSNVHPEDRARVIAELEKFHTTFEPFVSEYRVSRHDGRIIWVRDLAKVLFGKSGKPLYSQGIIFDITDRKMMEESLRESEEKFRSLSEANADFIMRYNRQCRHIYVNAAVARMSGIPVEEFIGKTLRDVGLDENECKTWEDMIRTVFDSGTPQQVESHFKGAEGTKYLDLRMVPEYSNDGRVETVLAVSRDITDRKQAEDALQENANLLRSILEATADGILAVSNAGEIINFNAKFRSMWHASEHLFVSGKNAPLLDLILTQLENPENFLSKVRSLYASASEDFDTLYCVDGRVVESFSCPLIREGDVEGRVWSFRDVTVQKDAERALKRNEEKYRDLVENANCIILRIDTEGRITFFNEYAQKFFGFAEDEIIGENVLGTIIPPNLLGRDLMKTIHDIYRHPDRNITHETESMRRNGERVWLTWTNKIIRDENGRSSGVLCIGNDITERKRAEDALRETKVMLQSLIHASPFGINLLDENGCVILWNPAAQTIYGWSEREVLYRYNPTILEAEEADFREFLGSVFAGHSQSPREVFRKRKDGTVVEISLSSAPVRDASGRVVASLGMFSDVTEQNRAEKERRELERQLRQVQKMEAVGTLAGGIAHDFNNILAAIVGYTDMALQAADGGSPAHSYLEEVLHAGFRAKELVRQILYFSRRTDAQDNVPVQVSLVLKEAMKMMRASLPATLEIEQNIQSDRTVLADPTQIHQIIINLCTNAAHAMEGRGTLRVSLTETQTAEPEVSSGCFLRLEVSDTGYGMTRETMERIFEPYFTTKAVGEGTGLGLSVVHGIVAKYGGKINVHSLPGEGSTFEVLLPSVDAEVAPAALLRGESVLMGQGERILFIDDEEAITRMSKDMLEDLNYSVTCKTSGIEALELFLSNPAGFDLVITDFTMPQITGAELAREMMNARTDIPVILCTGYNEQITKIKAQEIGIREFLLKPISRSEFSRAIRNALDKGNEQA